MNFSGARRTLCVLIAVCILLARTQHAVMQIYPMSRDVFMPLYAEGAFSLIMLAAKVIHNEGDSSGFPSQSNHLIVYVVQSCSNQTFMNFREYDRIMLHNCSVPFASFVCDEVAI